MFLILGVPFHLYGLCLSIGMLIGMWLIEKKATKLSISEKDLWPAMFWAGVAAVIGARLYHVFSELPFYSDQWQKIPQVWLGGLSIIGGVMGAVVGLVLYIFWTKKSQLHLLQFLDLSIFGLPFGQAVGRLGNYFNQELYGLPTKLPWAVVIDLQHRLPGFEQYQTFHPLFAYEAIAMCFFGGLVWKNYLKWPFGKGLYFFSYLIYYSLLRFCLEFLRIDKRMIAGSKIGINQAIMIGVFLVSTACFFYIQRRSKYEKK